MLSLVRKAQPLCLWRVHVCRSAHTRIWLKQSAFLCMLPLVRTCTYKAALPVCLHLFLTAAAALVGVTGFEAVVYVGCFQDTNANILGNSLALQDGQMTVQACFLLAKDKGYSWFGVTSGTDCYGGASVASDAEVIDDSSCDAKCTLATYQKCGGDLKTSVYRVQGEQLVK